MQQTLRATRRVEIRWEAVCRGGLRLEHHACALIEAVGTDRHGVSVDSERGAEPGLGCDRLHHE
jgi:hypothetical protein